MCCMVCELGDLAISCHCNHDLIIDNVLLSHLLRLVKFSPCQSGSQIALEGFRLLWKVSDCFGRFLNFVILSCDPACHAEVTDESESDGDDSSSPSTWHVFKLTSFTISS